MTARQIIEARLGQRLPPTRDLAPDQRQAILLLGRQLIKDQMANAAAPRIGGAVGVWLDYQKARMQARVLERADHARGTLEDLE